MCYFSFLLVYRLKISVGIVHFLEVWLPLPFFTWFRRVQNGPSIPDVKDACPLMVLIM